MSGLLNENISRRDTHHRRDMPGGLEEVVVPVPLLQLPSALLTATGWPRGRNVHSSEIQRRVCVRSTCYGIRCVNCSFCGVVCLTRAPGSGSDFWAVCCLLFAVCRVLFLFFPDGDIISASASLSRQGSIESRLATNPKGLPVVFSYIYIYIRRWVLQQ